MATLIDDADDPRLADFRGLRDRELRTRAGASGPEVAVFVAEGDPVISRAIRAGYRLRAILVDVARVDDLPDGVIDGDHVLAVDRSVAATVTRLGVHRGALAVLDRRPVPSVDEVLAGARRVLVLEGVVNPVNLGVIARTAVALGVDAMLLSDGCADPLYRRASRVSMGEVFSLPYSWIGPLPAGLAHLDGFTTVALTPAGSATDLGSAGLAALDRVALLFGAEGDGLRSETMAACDRRVRIPLCGSVDSLNVGAAVAIACWELSGAGTDRSG